MLIGKKGGPQGSESKPTIPIRYRTFATNVDSGVYALTVQSENKILISPLHCCVTRPDKGANFVDLDEAHLGRVIPVAADPHDAAVWYRRLAQALKASWSPRFRVH